MADDLFASSPSGAPHNYDASAIEVLEGLEPVRRRPGMYIGGIDERALHHLAAEVLDNAMDEAVAGHATRIEVTLAPGNRITIVDNGRGMPIDEHPKYPGKSALEVILTMLHSGGKFSNKAYATSGGLHGVGISVVNALSVDTVVEVARDKQVVSPDLLRGLATTGSRSSARRPTAAAPASPSRPTRRFSARRCASSRRGSTASPAPRPISMPASRYAGAAIPALIGDDTPAEAVFQFPGGLADHLKEQLGDRACATAEPFIGRQDFPDGQGSVEWAVAWPLHSDGSYFLLLQHHPDPRRRHP
jgi:topoisomerase-4 subunit B